MVNLKIFDIPLYNEHIYISRFTKMAYLDSFTYMNLSFDYAYKCMHLHREGIGENIAILKTVNLILSRIAIRT